MLTDEKLSAYLDGDLSDEERIEVQVLLEREPEAARRLAELEEIRGLLTSTPIAGPSRDLWAAIEAEVTRPRWWELTWVKLTLPLGVAAAAALAFIVARGPGSASTPSSPLVAVDEATPGEDEQLLAAAESEIARAKESYLAAIAMLEQRAERYTERLPDEERMKLKTSLFEVEQAIARVEGVIHDNPADVSAHTTLVALYDQKMRVLKSTVDVAESFLGQQRVEK